MQKSGMPSFEDIINISDPDFQTRIAKVKDFIIAAALQDASLPIREKILSNLSPRRKEVVSDILKEFKILPKRTKLVARQVITKIIFGIEYDQTESALLFGNLKDLSNVEPPKAVKPISKKEYENFIKKAIEQNPDFISARQTKRAITRAVYIKKMLEKLK
jgi:hypothetical protein